MDTKGSGAAPVEHRGVGPCGGILYNMWATVGWKSLDTTANIKGDTIIIDVRGPKKGERPCCAMRKSTAPRGYTHTLKKCEYLI